MRVAKSIELNDDERATLQSWERGRTTQARRVKRARIVLLAADGKLNEASAQELGIGSDTGGGWRLRFASERVAGIEKDLPRGGRRPTARTRVESKIIELVTRGKPRNATHWSSRTISGELGIIQSLAHRVLNANGMKLHLIKTFKLSNDPDCELKLRDVFGLYLNPPDNALVISADEKSSIQALDRTQPSLLIVRGRCETMTHDYKRNGTTTLFAAIELARSAVIARSMARHRHQEWIKFLGAIDEETPPELDLHLITDNYATHKHLKVRAWLKKHPRFHVHFTPISSSWLNVVERFLRDLDQKRLKRGAFESVGRLIDAITGYVNHHNELPKPIVWTATVERILDKVGRARTSLNDVATA